MVFFTSTSFDNCDDDDHDRDSDEVDHNSDDSDEVAPESLRVMSVD